MNNELDLRHTPTDLAFYLNAPAALSIFFVQAGSVYDLTDAIVTAELLDNGLQPTSAGWTVGFDGPGGLVTLSLSAADTVALQTGRFVWALKIQEVGDTEASYWMGGQLKISELDTFARSTSATVTVNVGAGLIAEVAAAGTVGPVGPEGPPGPQGEQGLPGVAGVGDLLAANNLSDLDDIPTARTNLGLGTAATTAATDYATATQGATADTALQAVADDINPQLGGDMTAAGFSIEDLGALEERVNIVAAAGATLALDVSAHGVHDVTLDQNCTLSFTNPAPAGEASSFLLILRGGFTPTLPASVQWADATAPTYGDPAIYAFTTVDAGVTWLGAFVGGAFS